MSYILKALRKSEAERAKGTVPRLTTRHDPGPPLRRKLWPVLAAGALLVNLGLVALVLWQPGLLPGQWGADDPAGRAQAEMAPESPAKPTAFAATDRQTASLDGAGQVGPAEAPPGPDEQVVHEQPPAVAPAVLEPAAAPPPETAPEIGSDVRIEAVTSAPAKEQIATEETVVETARPKPVTPKPVTPKPVTLGQFLAEESVAEPAAREETARKERTEVAKAPPRPKAKPAFRALIAEPTSEDNAAETTAAKQLGRDQLAWAVPEPEVPPVPEPPDLFADVPELWRMSQAFRQSVPEMTISVHVYSPEQSSRFIIIDRRKYLEGDRLNGGVLLEAILPQGVVFNLNGQQFKLTSG